MICSAANDRHGHATGDSVLRLVARTLQSGVGAAVAKAGEAAAALVHRADTALYRAKREGRNTVRLDDG